MMQFDRISLGRQAREAMLKERELINEHIRKYMTALGYNLSPKSK